MNTEPAVLFYSAGGKMPPPHLINIPTITRKELSLLDGFVMVLHKEIIVLHDIFSPITDSKLVHTYNIHQYYKNSTIL